MPMGLDLGDAVLFVVVMALAGNHFLLRLPGALLKPWLFWPVQVSNIAFAAYLFNWGIPGLDGNLAIFNYVVAMLFVFRAVQNNSRWGRARREARTGDVQADDEKKSRIAAALRKGSQAEDD